MKPTLIFTAAALAFAIIAVNPIGAQNAGKAAPKADAKAAPAPLPAGGAGGAAFPQRPLAPAEVRTRGEALYKAECAFCHGEDARGGDMGSNIIRSQIVLNDDKGERIAPVLTKGEGVEGTMMPKFSFNQNQIADLAGFLHSFRVNGYDGSRMRPETIVVGNAQAGLAYFAQRCSSCHSPTGDLKGIGTRINDPRTLQQRWLNPSAGGRGQTSRPTTVTVTLANNQKVEGTLVRIDDFLVTLTLADGRQRTIKRDNDTPRVELKDPYQTHKDLYPAYTDTNIHDLTAYLVTLK
jgi:mono/diheme cytochrome c family protein/small nuclear ribonucleoprotein (snRNP)-like protein